MTTRTTRLVVGVGSAAAAALTGLLVRAYQHDLAAAWNRLDAVEKKHVNTPFGTVEYAESGSGEPILVSHGIFHGCDGGLLSVRDLLPGRRIIAPSRFGYLGSDLPAAATAAAQADAFAALLDHRGIGSVDVVGISAGTTAALEFALRHPHRTTHLVLVSGNLPGDPTAVAPPTWARWMYTGPVLWGMRRLAPPMLSRMMGVPAGFPRTVEQVHTVDEMLDSIFPVAPRRKGAVFDAYLSNPAVNDVAVETLTVPTLLVHAKDDPLCTFAPVEAVARRIPGCTLVALESGGHLGLGQEQRTRDALDDFLAARVAA
jgi:pimeloyl-ACP methyl ester carboxylesterase